MSRVSSSSSKKQAAYATKKVNNIGVSRKNNPDAQGTSVRTINAFNKVFERVSDWIKEAHETGAVPKNFPGKLMDIDHRTATTYLNERADVVMQKTLNLERRALEALLIAEGKDADLPVIKSEIGQKGELAAGSRYYTKEQVGMITSKQGEKNELSTRIAQEAGLRAHELVNIRRYDEALKAGDLSARDFSKFRFVGRESMGGRERYVVTGKGGMVREIWLSKETAKDLETRRLDHARPVYDRGVKQYQRYDIGGGRAWSQSFSDMSNKHLGWSRGAHGLRHSYAQDRMIELQAQGVSWKDALRAVSHELGHLSERITLTYLR